MERVGELECSWHRLLHTCGVEFGDAAGLLSGSLGEAVAKEGAEGMGSSVQKCVCIATIALQGNSKQAFLHKTKQAGKKVEFLGKWLGKGGSRSW